MALFGKKKLEERKTVEIKTVSNRSSTSSGAHVGHLSGVLVNPRVTEKASSNINAGVYTFDVSDRAGKRSIKEAIFEAYGVRPRMVRIVTIQRKIRRNARTGQSGLSRGGKKAYVYLKKGEMITIS
ncbi:MAG: 50S ribosomal protein L23 [Patescibacteria group bacterium]